MKPQSAEAGEPMARKAGRPAAKPKPGGHSPDTVQVEATNAKGVDAATARTILRPTVTAALAIRTTHKAVNGIRDGPGITALVDELSAQCKAVTAGNMARPEALLTAQAHTLDTLFSDLVRRAFSHRELDPYERLMRLAFKAQSQSRATVETLATIKNPPMVFAKQANLTSGPQQINNGLAREIPAAVPNKLLEQTNGERLDPIAASGTVGGDPAVATLGARDGAANG